MSLTQVGTMNRFKPDKFSYFSPNLHHKALYNNNLKANVLEQYTKKRKDSTISDRVHEDVFKTSMNSLKDNSGKLKIAVSYILLEILSMFSNVKRAHSQIIDQQMNPENSPVEESNLKYKRRNSAVNDEIETLLKELKISDQKLDPDVLFNKVSSRIFEKIVNERSERTFAIFLGKYIKKLERKLFLMDINSRHNNQNDSFDSDKELQGIGPYSDIKNIRLRTMSRRESGDSFFSSIFSVSSVKKLDSEFNEKVGLLNYRITFSPSIAQSLRLRTNPIKMLRNAGYDLPTYNKRRDSNGVQSPDKIKKTRQKSLIPFRIEEFNIPIFIKARAEGQRRRWTYDKTLQEASPEKPTYTYNNSTFTILAVDDSDFALKALEHLKLDFKREFHFARNGFEAFSKHKALCADRQLYHLILMDLMMPVSDGYEATKMIRDFEMSSGIPRSYICGLSSNEADEAIRAKCIEAGMDEYCKKPLIQDKLTALMKRRCEDLGLDPRQFSL